jgi:predicted dehydrogenase
MIGFGMIGKMHAYAYATLPYYTDPPRDRFAISHVVTAHESTARAAAKIAGAEHASTDFREVTENPDVEIVHICTPNPQHHPALLSAIAHGKHIYCEKPLTADWQEARDIHQELSSYRAVSQMAFHLRFFPALLRAKEFLAEGRLGRLLEYRVGYYHASNANPRGPFKWKHDTGGGVLLDLATHLIDLIDHTVGGFDSLMADSVIAFPQRPVRGEPDRKQAVEVEDSVKMLARMQSGATGLLEATKLATGTEDELRLEIHGTEGALRFQLMEPHYLEFYDATEKGTPHGGDRGWKRIPTGRRYEPPQTDFPGPKCSMGWPRAHVASIVNFLQAVEESRPTQPDLKQGVKIQYLADAAFRSIAARRWVDVDWPI